MKKGSAVVLLVLFLLPIISGHSASAQNNWENVAVQEAKKQYPLGQVLFSQQIWSSKKEKKAVKQYKLMIRNGSEDIGVFVTIAYHPQTEKIQSITVLEE
ncbi:DUF3889 domain-containing protein [Metabacillus lacus]|uniref:DUF3889 domain-containing protein n=1 Tax=Metabacillus lacus TaxID=1983721 RepID=UPI0014797A62|nr:DUF3889 domain-containing protein [Metabacillus lacus]